MKWAEKVIELVPSAELVRFTASGTESTLLAMRVARGYTQTDTILKFEGHFHGWQDYALKGEKPPFESTTVPGVPNETLGTVAVLPANDRRCWRSDWCKAMLPPSFSSRAARRGPRSRSQEDFLKTVRDITRKHGVAAHLR